MNRKDIDIRNCNKAGNTGKKEQRIEFEELMHHGNNHPWRSTGYTPSNFDQVFSIGNEAGYYYYVAVRDDDKEVWVFRQKVKQ